MRKSRKFSKTSTKSKNNAIKALSVALLAGVSVINANPSYAETDSRIIIDAIDQAVTGDHSNIVNNDDWHTEDWSSGWYNEWDVNGGVVKNNSQNLTIKDATFDSNTYNLHNPEIVGDTSDPQWMSVVGGVIGNTANSSIKSIDNVTFSNNITNATYKNQYVKGGVIGNAGTIDSITNSKFIGNKSKATSQAIGGAIFNADSGVINKISDSEISNNTSGSGGAIYNNGQIGAIENVNITNNTASSGSAIYNYGHIGKIENANILNNTGSEAILNRETIDLISGSKINGNSGNGITNMRAGATDNPNIGSIINSEFSNNCGYGIRSHSGSIGDIDGSTFSGNTLSGVYIYSDNNNPNYTLGNISNSLFENNGKSAIYLDNSGVLGNITKTTFLGNKGRHGGAIYINDRTSSTGAIHSIGNFTDVTFENNEATGMGGAIALDNVFISNIGNFKNVTFKNNKTGAYGKGGAIAFNGSSTVGTFENVRFEGNSAHGGGAINIVSSTWLSPMEFKDWTNVVFKGNSANVGSAITALGGYGDKFGNWNNVSFIDNVLTLDGAANGGVLAFNKVTVGDWTGGIMQGVENNVYANRGGGIGAEGSTFGNITDVNFVNLHAKTNGGAIYNDYGTFGNLKNVTFENTTSGIQGGAIWNEGNGQEYGIFGNLENVHFNKVGLDTSLVGGYSSGLGGAIYNSGIIGNWNNGSAYGFGSENRYVASQGGAIWNEGTFGTISNVLFKDFAATTGGAVWTNGKMKGFTNTSFINNKATTYGGGAIMVSASAPSGFGLITKSLFQDNLAHSVGGAVASYGFLDGITASTFVNNTAGNGGAIYSANKNVGTLKDLTFVGNKAIGKDSDTSSPLAGDGGAIAIDLNESFKLEGQNKFINNSAKTSGGAIYSSGTISDLGESYFEGNTSGSTGGAIHSWISIDKVNNSTFVNNKTEGKASEMHRSTYSGGGAIYSSGKIKEISNSTFARNEVTGMTTDTFNSGNGGAIFTFDSVENIQNSEFNGNKAINKGGAIWTANRIEKIENSIFANNQAGNNGGALLAENGIGTISNSSFLNNTSKNGKGGAIYTTKDLNIISKNGYNSLFSGNSAKVNGAMEQNAIYIDSPDSQPVTLTLDAQTRGRIILNDSINGNKYDLKVTGDNTGEIYINNKIANANITQTNVTSYVGNSSYLNYGNSLAVNSGIMNINSMGLAPLHLKTFSNDGTININSVDINPATETMGRVTADNYGSFSGSINVNGLNVLADPVKDKTDILFADSAFANTVKYNGSNEYMGKIYKYSVNYLPESGEFEFIRGGGTAGGSEAFNPAVLAAPVNAQAGANATVNETFKYVFEHADAFTQLPSMERLSMIKSNQYALSSDFNSNLGNIATEFNNKAGWVRPYATFEKMNLRNAPAVNATTYGTLVGFDSDFQQLKHGWIGLTTGYVGYNGSQLHYHGGDTSMNGGVLGLTQSFYKGNFWSALTLSTGASVGQTTNAYGHEDFTTLLAGVGSKTGYNFEFKEGRYIIQPIWFMSYTFGKTFDYTSASGVRINADPMHSILLNPSVRFIANTKNGWQPYASVGMVWNAMNVSNVTADNVKLPNSSIKPYVEYGVGVQKRFKDHFVAFGQAMIRNGGRNGIALTTGFRWAIGHECHYNEKVQSPTNDKTVSIKKFLPPTVSVKLGDARSNINVTSDGRKIVKQLSQEQRARIAKQYQNTTRTTSIGDVKKL